MAIYHLHAQIIGRSDGQSAVAAAAYRSTSKLTDKETGDICDYTRKAKALKSFILSPAGSPIWATDRTELWNSVHEKESRKNSQLAFSYEVAIPKEIKNDEAMIRYFLQKNFVDKGLIVDANKHAPHRGGDKKNIHWHFMVTTRTITPEGWGDKFRIGENKFADRQNWLNEIRQSWEDVCNAELKRIGSKERIDCHTLEAQGIDREATQHQGPTATKMEREGKRPRRTKEKKNMNAFIDTIETEPVVDSLLLADLDREIEKANKKAAIVSNIKGYEGTLKNEELKSKALATREHLPEIEKANVQDRKQNKADKKELMESMPPAIVPKPNAPKNLFMEWRSSDEDVHKTYEDYATRQINLLKKWEVANNKNNKERLDLNHEETLIKEAKQDGLNIGADSLNRLLEIYNKQNLRRPKIFESIKTRAAEMLKTAKEFRPFRELKELIAEVKNELKGPGRVNDRGNQHGGRG